ncbi:ZIP metal ion transporter family isoform 4 [Theobroma cacao]|uniref:ZIP metal ion transporter family isoform 4 n=1 Tax=Theobroma cacao TaxID=3641 RepID=A0A061E9I2_THECC|nr:ZIP metal ion transporter family isoform 4 [Theobroma cacao]
MLVAKTWIFLAVLLVLVSLDLCFASGSGMSPANGDHGHHHHCDHGHGHGHDHHHHHDHDHHQHHHVVEEKKKKKMMVMLPEELAEEEDMKLYGFGPYRDDHDHQVLSGFGLWLRALGCSLLVSLASLICLIILPVIFIQGKPSKAVVDSLALFGAGAMLGDAFLHQLPHAFGGEHSHSHDDHVDDAHHSHSGPDHLHGHSLKDLSVGLSILAGIVMFLLVEKVVRYVEENSEEASHGHHHHHHKSNKKLKNDDDVHQNHSQSLDDRSDDPLNGDNTTQHEIRKRKTSPGPSDDKSDIDPADGCANSVKTLVQKETSQSPSNLVFGYLNLFSDGVHNFTDGMALGSAFLLYGSVGGWSRTLFLLAHELPQEVGDFGILVRSGFSVSKALFFNFLSALVALAGTGVALLLGQDPGQSSLIEVKDHVSSMSGVIFSVMVSSFDFLLFPFLQGFTAGGFIYIAVAGVLAEMNSNSNSTLKSTIVQLISLTFGMAVALFISLVE